MQANPDKFQVLVVGKKTFDKNMKICIQNSTLSCEETVKLTKYCHLHNYIKYPFLQNKKYH
jgi:hypothetical protein